MGDKENDILESETTALIHKEYEPSTKKQSSKQSKNGKETIVSSVPNKPTYYVTSDDKNNLTDSEVNEQKKDDFQTRNFFCVELFLFLMMLGSSVASVCNKTLYLEKACSVYLNYSSDVCKNLTFYKTENDEAQKVANNFSLYTHLITMIPAAVLAIFIGSWSDKYGTKKPILMAFLGIICQDILLLLNSQYMKWPLSYILLTAVPTGLTGSFITINTCVYSFASEKTATKGRTLKYAILELTLMAAMPAGTFVGGRLYQAWSYMPVYALTLTAHATGFLYIAVTMQDTRNTDGHGFKTLISEFFSLNGLKENVRTCMKSRENHGRTQIWLLIGSMCIIIMSYAAPHEIAFYFCEKMYGWSMTTYSDISTISTLVSIFVMVITVPLLTRVRRVPDAFLGILGSLSSMGQSLIRSFAYQEWIYYTALGIGSLSAFNTLAVRSRLSKVVRPDEVGKVFAVLMSCESLVPIFGSLVFLQIYNATIESFPGLAYLCGAILMIMPFISFVFILRWEITKHQSMEHGIDEADVTSVQ